LISIADTTIMDGGVSVMKNIAGDICPFDVKTLSHCGMCNCVHGYCQLLVVYLKKLI